MLFLLFLFFIVLFLSLFFDAFGEVWSFFPGRVVHWMCQPCQQKIFLEKLVLKDGRTHCDSCVEWSLISSAFGFYIVEALLHNWKRGTEQRRKKSLLGFGSLMFLILKRILYFSSEVAKRGSSNLMFEINVEAKENGRNFKLEV